jgi:hypothetical protein
MYNKAKIKLNGPMSYLRYLCLFAHSGVQHILRCDFSLFVFVFVPYVADFPGLPIFECHFGIL